MKLYFFLTSILVILNLNAAAMCYPLEDISKRTLNNKTAYVPPQCYTKTIDDKKEARNPCYVCHTESKRPNYINDADLQSAYDFNDTSFVNPWTNLFKDRTKKISTISDEEITAYINTSNYFDEKGNIILRQCESLPEEWDYENDGHWAGWIPDAWFNFDDEGFDRDPQGKLTGWRAFGYYPFPGTFWPTNGSTGDVMIRLPSVFRINTDGKEDLSTYKVNLAIVESIIKEKDINIDPVDEALMSNVDLNKDGIIGIADKIKYQWAPLKGQYMYYVGQAYDLQLFEEIHMAAGLFPKGTEFLHTIRYIAVDEAGNNHLSKRMKEVRYARKHAWFNYSRLRDKIYAEFKEKDDFPDRIRTILGNHEKGISNGQGWTYQALIEDQEGNLRPQSYEELVFCAGCHGGIGATRDGIFSFARKLSDQVENKGWFHWSQKGLKGIGENKREDGEYEYTFYLKENRSGNEYRSNEEIQNKFFDADGNLIPEQLDKLHTDISHLLFASKERALLLNKAYKIIVQEQSFDKGRDAIILPFENIHQQTEIGEATGIINLIKGY